MMNFWEMYRNFGEEVTGLLRVENKDTGHTHDLNLFGGNKDV